MRQLHNHKKGFSLVEAAIVLGVVGFVLGGIWYAAAKFYEDYKVNKTVDSVETIARNFQDLISIRIASAITGGYSYFDVSKSLFDAGVFPKDFTYGKPFCCLSGNRVMDSFGYPVVLTAFQSPARMNMDYFLRSKRECINVLVAVSTLTVRMRRTGGYGNPSALASIGTPSSGYISSSTFPISPQQAETACSGFIPETGNAKLLFVYSFG